MNAGKYIDFFSFFFSLYWYIYYLLRSANSTFLLNTIKASKTCSQDEARGQTCSTNLLNTNHAAWSANPVRIQVKFCFICTCFGVNFCSSGACGIRALPARSSVGVSSLCPWCRLHLVLLPPCLPSAHLHVPCFLFHLFVTCASIIIQFLGFSGFDYQKNDL